LQVQETQSKTERRRGKGLGRKNFWEKKRALRPHLRLTRVVQGEKDDGNKQAAFKVTLVKKGGQWGGKTAHGEHLKKQTKKKKKPHSK